MEFKNTEIAFKHLNNFKLKKAYFLFLLISYHTLTKIGLFFIQLAFLLKIPIGWLIKITIFDQFCGGESARECQKKIKALSKFNIKTILDYSIEGKSNKKDFKLTLNETLKNIKLSSENKNIPFVVLKLSSIFNKNILKKKSSKLELNNYEKNDFDYSLNILNKILIDAKLLKVPVMIDAEESWYQNEIDSIIEKMILKYNDINTIIFTTIQMYRHDRIHYLKYLLKICKKKDIQIGIKLVRGAYLEKENNRAIKHNYKSPIHLTKINCDNDFNQAIKFICKNISFFSLCLGSHNETSTGILMQSMKKLNIKKNNSKIYFSQLLGMSDNISFNLSKLNYNVVKYVPYGPVNEVLPYLIRRIEENSSVKGQLGREIKLIKRELKRRKYYSQ